MPRCLGTDGCIHSSITSIYNVALNSCNSLRLYGPNTCILDFLAIRRYLVRVTRSSIHYFNDPLSWLLHIENSFHCRLFSNAHSRFLLPKHVVSV